MLKHKRTTALVLSAILPALAQAQEATAPPPPGPYQAMSVAMPAMPPIAEAPQMAQRPQMAEASAPTATQIWGRPSMMQMPYWMQAPASATSQQDRRQGAVSPDARPERGGGQAPTTQLSPAGQPTAPTISGPGFGVGVTPGFFPGYSARQDGGAQVQMGAASGAASQAQAGNRGQYGAGYGPGYGPGYGYGYGAQPPYQAYPGYPAYQGYSPYPGQMPLPYWGAPMAPAYPYPGQVNR